MAGIAAVRAVDDHTVQIIDDQTITAITGAVVDIKPFTILSEPQVRRNVEKIRDKYLDEGFYLAEVLYRVLPVFHEIFEDALREAYAGAVPAQGDDDLVARVSLIDERGERLTVRATRGFKPETIPLLTFAPGEGVAGIAVLHERHPAVERVDAAGHGFIEGGLGGVEVVDDEECLAVFFLEVHRGDGSTVTTFVFTVYVAARVVRELPE